MAENNDLAKLKFVEMWAIARLGVRSPWIIPGSVRPTRNEAIDAFIFDGSWSVWQGAYNRGFRAVKVTVTAGWSC